MQPAALLLLPQYANIHLVILQAVKEQCLGSRMQPSQRLPHAVAAVHALQAPCTDHGFLWCICCSQQECCTGWSCAVVSCVGPLDQSGYPQLADVSQAVQMCGAVEG